MAAANDRSYDFRFTYRLPADDCEYVEEISFDHDEGIRTPAQARAAFERHWKEKGGVKVVRVELVAVLA